MIHRLYQNFFICTYIYRGAYFLTEIIAVDLAVHIVSPALFKRLEVIDIVIYYNQYIIQTVRCRSLAYHKTASYTLRGRLPDNSEFQDVIFIQDSLTHRDMSTEIHVGSWYVINEFIWRIYAEFAVFFTTRPAHAFKVFYFGKQCRRQYHPSSQQKKRAAQVRPKLLR